MGMFNNGKRPTGIDFKGDPGRTKQSFTKECDINSIIKQYEKTGMIENLNEIAPFYGDVSDIIDYQGALNIVNKAEELFMDMSPDIRERFENNPQNMIDFLNDSKNREEAVKMGMVNSPIPEPLQPEAKPTEVVK